MVSFVVVAFEVLVTRISSVIFVNSFAFIVLSLAILGLGLGGFIAHVKRPTSTNATSTMLACLSGSMMFFALAVTRIPLIDHWLVFFCLLVVPFICAGMFFATVFRTFAMHSFRLYAVDLVGAAFGALATLILLPFWGPIHSVLILGLVLMGCVVAMRVPRLTSTVATGSFLLLITMIGWIHLSGPSSLADNIPVGRFPEKDIHHVYDNPNIRSTIIDSRWSVFGRSDLVSHSHQDLVRHLFIDGAAGSQMFRFNGSMRQPDPYLRDLLPGFTSTLPIQTIEHPEELTMMVIGPGGGKMILVGVLDGFKRIVGVEINPDFVQLVKDHSAFNGGLYTRFSNVDIEIQEGRHYARQNVGTFDVITLVLPSTQQLQSIQNHALSENYLLTVEAVRDYLHALTPNGSLMVTVYNEAELKRLITTTLESFATIGVSAERVPYHLLVIEDPFAPTLIMRKQAFTASDIARYLAIQDEIQPGYPRFSYLPYVVSELPDTRVNRFLSTIANRPGELDDYIKADPFDIRPTYDDRPYFYNVDKGLPSGLSWLLVALIGINMVVVAFPLYTSRPKRKAKTASLLTPILLFSCLGLGFILVEVSLFHKLVLYLGSPTISLSIMLSSLLLGMGIGSYSASRIPSLSTQRRLIFCCGSVAVIGVLVILIGPEILDQLVAESLWVRGITTFLLLLPLGVAMGVPFPTGIQWLEERGLGESIPWMYGINGTMSVLGSVLAISISMTIGFTPTFYVGILFYVAMVAYFLRLEARSLI